MEASKPFKLIPDEVFANSPLLQKLQAQGLYDQEAITNRAPMFQVIPEEAFMAQGAWGATFFSSDVFQQSIADKNSINLPHRIIAALIAEGRPINPPFPPYLEYTTEFVRQAAERSTAAVNAKLGTAVPNPNDCRVKADEPSPAWIAEFNKVVCGYITTTIERLTPGLCSGELPLSVTAPGFDPKRAKSPPH